MAVEVRRYRRVFGFQARKHRLVGGFLRELGQLQEVVYTRGQAVPDLDLLAQTLGRAQQLLGCALVAPEVGCAGLLVELGQPLRLCG